MSAVDLRERLAKLADGAVLGPGDPMYEKSRRVFNAMIDRRPAVILRCSGPEDVLHGVTAAREHGVPLSIKGGGHSVAGNAVCEGGLMLDMSAMKGISVDPERQVAVAEAGLTLGQFDAATSRYGLATTLGVVSMTGIAGLTLHMEMNMMVESGLTPMQALQSATGWAAALLNGRRKSPAAPTVGVIAEGAYADLVVLSANPLDNIGNSKKIERVMKGGRFVPLGYTTNYGAPKPSETAIIPKTPEPEISAITPHVAVEGSPDFEMTIEGVGFVGNSVVRVDDVPALNRHCHVHIA